MGITQEIAGYGGGLKFQQLPEEVVDGLNIFFLTSLVWLVGVLGKILLKASIDLLEKRDLAIEGE